MTRAKFALVAIPLCLALSCWVFSSPILRGIGSLLVRDGQPVAADMIIVLAGDGMGHRVLKGAELAREGFAPVVLVSTGGAYYGHPESDLATDFAVQHGYPPELLVPVHWQAHSTVEEARHAIEEFRKRSAHKVIVVTSVWHTARSGRIYRRLAPDLEFYLVGVDDPTWKNGDWWVDREGRKTFLMESVKTIADFLRI